MGGKASRRKGDRRERQVVEWLNSLGFEAQRVPASGAAGGKFAHDVHLEFPGGGTWFVQVKGRKEFRTLTKWMPKDSNGKALPNGIVALVLDRLGTTFMLSEASFAFLLKAAARYNPVHDTSETSAYPKRIVADGDPVGHS